MRISTINCVATMYSTYKTSFEETEVHPDNYIAGVRIHAVQMSRGSITRASPRTVRLAAARVWLRVPGVVALQR